MRTGMMLGVLATRGGGGPIYDPTRSLELNGIDQYATVGAALAGYTGGNLTVAGWVKLDDNAKGGILAPSGTGWSTAGVSVRFVAGTARIRIAGASGYRERRSATTIATGAWVHVLFTYLGSGSGTATIPDCYINNVLSNGTSGGAGAGVVDDTVLYEIGAYFSGSRSFLDGRVHGVRWAPQVLSAGQRAEWFAGGPPSEDAIPGTGFWLTRTDDAIPGTIHDLLGSYDGTPVNSPTLESDAP